MNDFSSAVETIEQILADEKKQSGLKYPALAMLHQHASERAVVFLHGFTNSPEQFRVFGERFFQQGYNVWIPRQPFHGFEDRHGRPLQSFQIKKYLQDCEQAVEIGRHLGRKLIVAGLSGGANAAIHLAQTRAEIDLAVIMAPSLGVQFVPSVLTRPVVFLLGLLPDRLIWWDDKTKADNPDSPQFAYTAFATRAMGQMIRLGQNAKASTRRHFPKARRVLVISNEGDRAVNQTEINQLVTNWKGFPGLVTYQIPLSAQVPHDFISLGMNAERNRAMYDTLFELIDRNI